MSLINTDDDQRWVPTHVQVTVLRGRGLRAKGKHGTSDVYTIIQVGKEKFSTCVVEKTTAPEWKEECSFELLPGVLEADGRSAYPLGSSDLVLTVMHRALIGLDVFLGQAIIPLDKVFQDRICMRNEWYKLNSKTGKKEKERGEVQVTVQFTRNNLTASMYDLSMKDKPRSTFGKLKDRMKGKKREDSESASAIVPGGFGALAQRRGRLPSDGGGEEEYEDDEGGEGRRSKMRNFFLRGKLRKSSDTRSSTSLGSESSESSSRGGSLSPTAGISVVVSDLSNSPSESSNLTADNSPDHTTHPSPKLITHKRAFSDEASQIKAAPPQPRLVESLKAQSGVLSQSSLCINGSHVYTAEPLAPGSAATLPATLPVTLPATLGLLQKCSPLSRSLQNLTRRSEDPQQASSGAEGRRWSFDKAGKEEKAAIAAALEQQVRPVQATAPLIPTVTVAEPANEGKKPKRNLFSHGRSELAGRGSDQGKVEQGQTLPPAGEKHKGWFGSKDSHNKPSPEVSPKVETSSDTTPPHLLSHSLDHLSCSPPASAISLAFPGPTYHANPFTPSPATLPITPSNPFFTLLQCNPFFVELLADQALKSDPPAPFLFSSPFWSPSVSSSWSGDLSLTRNCPGVEHTVGMTRQASLQGALGKRVRGSLNPFVASENPTEWDESFEAFAACRLGSQKAPTPSWPPEALSVCITNAPPQEKLMGQTLELVNADENNAAAENASMALPQRPSKIPVLEGHRNHWFNWIEEPGMKKNSSVPPQSEIVFVEHSKEEEERLGKEPIRSQEDTTDTGLFSERDPEKPSNSPVSPLQFMSTCSLVIKRTNTVKPATSPLHKHLETSGSGTYDDRVERLFEQEDCSCASAFALCTAEGAGRENYFTGNAPTVSGKEVVDNTASLPEVASEASGTEPEVSLAGSNQCFGNILRQKFSESLLERTDITAVTAPEHIYKTATDQMGTNTNMIVDAIEVTHVPYTNLYHSYADLINFPNSMLPNTDTASMLPVMTASDTEMKNNMNELTSVLSHSVPKRIMYEMNLNKPERLFTAVLEYSSPAQSVDCPNKVHSSSSLPLEEALPQSVPGESISAAEFPESRSYLVSMAPLVVSAGSSPEVVSTMPVASVQTNMENILGTAQKDRLERGRTYAYETLEPAQSHTSTEGQDAIPQRLEAALFTDMILDITRKDCTISFDAPVKDLKFNALVAHPENAWQENIDEEHKTNLNVKELSGTSTEDFISRSTLNSGSLEVKEPGPSTFSVPQALKIETLFEDPDTRNPSSTCTTHKAETSLQDLPLDTDGNKMASSSEEAGLTHSLYCMIDSSTAILESPSLESICTDHEVTQPPPKPPRLFQESFPHDQCMNESPQSGLGDFIQTKNPHTLEEPPTGFFQTLQVSSDPVTCQSYFTSECSDLSVGIENERDKSGDQWPQTFTIIEDELFSGNSILQSGLSGANTFAFDETSDRSWFTNQDYFKIKELDTSNMAVWSADQENAILTDSTCVDKSILMSTTFERETSQIPNSQTQLATSTYTCSPFQSSIPTDVAINLNEGLGESYLHQLKSTKQQRGTDRVESVWFPLPSASSLSSTISQDLVMDLIPEDLRRLQDKEVCQEALRQVPLDPEPFLLLPPSNLFSEFNIDTLPEGITAAIIPEGLHTNAVSSLRSHLPIGAGPTSSLFLHDSNPQASSTPSLLAETNAQFALFPSPIPAHLPVRPTTETTQASSTIPPSKAQPMIGTTFAGLPQETQPAASLLSSHQSSPHPVKPLTTTAPQEEKKSEGRSVLVSGLEKLKSTIHPGRAAQQGEPEADRNKALSEGAAPYYHLTHNELVSLLLQREAELERQGAEFQRQGALLEKRESELKKMKALIRDLEDYIDTLLVRIMEQTPTLLQVRSKLK